MKLHTLVVSLRQFRSWHRWIGISVALFLFFTAATGVLLGWKKNVDTLQPPMQAGTSTSADQWKSFEAIIGSADRAMDSVRAPRASLDRLDARIDKGIVKVIYSNYWEVQVDGLTGRALSVAKRHADWIEHVHDGSLIGDGFKLMYTTYLGAGLLVLSITGFWLWYGPCRVRVAKSSRRE